MRGSLPALLFLAIAAVDEIVRAADTEGLALVQVQPTPQQPPSPPWYQPRPRPEPPPLFEPRSRPDTPLQAPRAGGPTPCGHYTMRVLPANPNIDPKFVMPGADSRIDPKFVLPAPAPRCR